MGCWNATCALSNLHIKYGEPVYVFVLTRLDGYATSWEPVMLPIAATYDSYGSFENADENLDQLLKWFSKYKVLVDDTFSDKVEVTYDSLGRSCHNPLFIEEDDGGFVHQIAFAMVKKSVVDTLLQDYTLRDEYRQWEFSWKGIDTVIRNIVQSCRSHIQEVSSWNLRQGWLPFLKGNSPDYWGDDTECKNPNGAVKLLSAYWSNIRYSVVDTSEGLLEACNDNESCLSATWRLKDLLTASFVCEMMRITRKSWQPESDFMGSQSEETSGYLALCKAIEKEIQKETGNER